MHLNKEPIIEYLSSQRHADEVDDRRRLRRTARTLRAPHRGHGSLARQARSCSSADADAEYAAVIEIDLADDQGADRSPARTIRTTSRLLSEVAGAKIDEVFIGSLHDQHRPLPRRRQAARRQARHPGASCGSRRRPRWTRMMLTEEGYYGVLGNAGARIEMPGCSLCMGNQAQVREGRDGDVHLARATSPTVWASTPASISARPNWRRSARCWAGSRPWPSTWTQIVRRVNAKAADVYRYMNFDQIAEFVEAAQKRAA